MTPNITNTNYNTRSSLCTTILTSLLHLPKILYEKTTKAMTPTTTFNTANILLHYYYDLLYAAMFISVRPCTHELSGTE